MCEFIKLFNSPSATFSAEANAEMRGVQSGYSHQRAARLEPTEAGRHSLATTTEAKAASSDFFGLEAASQVT